MNVYVNFGLKKKLKKRLDKTARRNGLTISEIIRRGIVNQIQELGGDSNEK